MRRLLWQQQINLVMRYSRLDRVLLWCGFIETQKSTDEPMRATWPRRRRVNVLVRKKKIVCFFGVEENWDEQTKLIMWLRVKGNFSATTTTCWYVLHFENRVMRRIMRFINYYFLCCSVVVDNFRVEVSCPTFDNEQWRSEGRESASAPQRRISVIFACDNDEIFTNSSLTIFRETNDLRWITHRHFFFSFFSLLPTPCRSLVAL